MIRDGQRRAEWVEKILPYAREHGAEVSTFPLSFSNQRSQTNIISLKHDSEHKISSLSSDLRSSGNMLGRLHGSQTLFLRRVQSRRKVWVFLKCKILQIIDDIFFFLLQRICRRQGFHEMTLYCCDRRFFPPCHLLCGREVDAREVVRGELCHTSCLIVHGDVHTIFNRRSSFVTSWSSCLLIIIHWKNSSRAMLHGCHPSIWSCH